MIYILCTDHSTLTQLILIEFALYWFSYDPCFTDEEGDRKVKELAKGHVAGRERTRL